MAIARPLACVMGDLDLVRPLGRAGIRCAVVAEPADAARYSRYTCATLDWMDSAAEPEAVVEQLVGFGRGQAEPPVLFYQEDRDLLLVSRYRNRLAEAFRFAIAEPALVEDLVDKGRFVELVARFDLPVPPMRRLSPARHPRPDEIDLRFPLIVKPLARSLTRGRWQQIADAKAVQVNTPAALQPLWQRLAAGGVEVIAQELIEGPETHIESYHVYVDGQGEIVGEFTGRKVRTYPVQFGYSTAVEITNCPDVAALGRDLTLRLDLRGVAKFDFKRGPDGRLHLLEINPRFNLWHYPGALAGVNLPALVYGDLTGQPRRAVPRARAGVRWCHLAEDARAAKEIGVPLIRWLPWALSCDAKGALAWNDPLPAVMPLLMPAVRAVPLHLARRLAAGNARPAQLGAFDASVPAPRMRRSIGGAGGSAGEV